MPDEETKRDWYKFLTEGEKLPQRVRHLMGLLPSSPRCKICNAPFKGWGGSLMRRMGREQSRYNPGYCQPCEYQEPGGAVIDLTMLFADVRGSTRLAEQLSAHEFSQLMNRFYVTATDALVRTDGFVDRLIGDEAIGLYVPAIAGTQHPRLAIEAAQNLLRLTGHGSAKEPWLPVGIGVHTGSAWVGVVGGVDGNPTDFTALGDNVNIAARLASKAGAGEVLISEATYNAARMENENLEKRDLELKGKSESVRVRVLHAR